MQQYYKKYGRGGSSGDLTDELVKGIAGQTGYTESAVRKILTEPGVSGPQDFTNWLRSIQTIWKQQ